MLKIGICLSGGSLKGIAGHCGFLKRINDLSGIQIKSVVGTSAGAVVAAMYCSGLTPQAIEEILCVVKLSDYVESSYKLRGLWRWFGPQKFLGMVRGKPFEQFMEEHLPVKTFEECPIRCHVVATNLSRGRPETFSSGPLIPPVRASMSIPFVFEAKEILGEWYEDGGMVSNAAVGALAKEDVDSVIVNNFFKPREEANNDFLEGSEIDRQSKMMNRRFEAVQSMQELANTKVMEDAGKRVIQLRPVIPVNVSLLKPVTEDIKKVIDWGYRETSRLLEGHAL